MKIGIVSDTHDRIDRVKLAVERFNQEKVGLVVHCGDIVAPFTLEFYKDIDCPIKFLIGNNGGDILRHVKYAGKMGLKDYEFKTFYALEVEGQKIAVYHGDDKEITEALIKCEIYDCVFSGHNHQAKVEKTGNTLYVNPGSFVDKYNDRMTEPSFAIYDTKNREAEIIKF